MKFVKTLATLCAALLLTAHAPGAWAQGAYPTRPVTLVVPYPAGVSDSLARMIATRLSQTWGQAVVVDNKPGASGVIGMMAGRNAPADGYTLLLGLNGPLSTNPHLISALPYDPLNDFTMIANLVRIPQMIAAHPTAPYSTLKELVDAAKGNPGKLEYGSPGPGTGSHLAAEMLQSRAGTQILHIPYKGTGPALTDLLAGHIKLMVTAVSDLAPHVKAGKLKALAVVGKARAPQLPDVPAVAETYPGFEAEGWAMLLGPRNLPQGIVDKISADLRRAYADPRFMSAMVDLGVVPTYQEGPELKKYVQSQLEAVGKIVKEAKIRLN